MAAISATFPGELQPLQHSSGTEQPPLFPLPVQLDSELHPAMPTLVHLQANPVEIEYVESITTQFEAAPAVHELTADLERAQDTDTLEHSRRVTLAALVIADRLGMNDRQLDNLAQAGLVHDVGKAHPELQPLVKSKVRFEGQARIDFLKKMAMHPFISAHRINESPYWGDEQKVTLIEIALAHHAFKAAGAYGIVPSSVNLAAAQVLAVADTLDAIASKRSYKEAFDTESGSIEAEVRKELVISEGVFRAAFNHIRRTPRFQRRPAMHGHVDLATAVFAAA